MNEKIRVVKILEFNGKGEKIYKGKMGLFHGWGVDYEEFETGPGNFSTAIVELADGSVENVYVTCIQFLTPNENTPLFEYTQIMKVADNENA